jgi:hypothetical protein
MRPCASPETIIRNGETKRSQNARALHLMCLRARSSQLEKRSALRLLAGARAWRMRTVDKFDVARTSEHAGSLTGNTIRTLG